LENYAPSSYAAQCYRDLWKEIKKTCIAWLAYLAALT
jgi:hypothetical protein